MAGHSQRYDRCDALKWPAMSMVRRTDTPVPVRIIERPSISDKKPRSPFGKRQSVYLRRRRFNAAIAGDKDIGMSFQVYTDWQDMYVTNRMG